MTTATVNYYAAHIEGILDRYDTPNALAELIADIIHYCDEKDLYFDEALAAGKDYYLNDREMLREID